MAVFFSDVPQMNVLSGVYFTALHKGEGGRENDDDRTNK
jgi:hypothetical protein